MYLRSEVPQRPVALVLGARVYADGRPSPSLADRLDLAKDLLDDGSVEVLLLSGDGHPERYDEPAAMRAYLVEAGVDPARIVVDPHGYDTHDSCGRAAEVYAVDALTVVSQSYHVPRAIAACRALGIDAVGVGDSAARDRKPDQWRSSVVREQLASVKAVMDLVTGGDTVLDGPDPAVQDALVAVDAAAPAS
ncbi:YdcF family protein [Sanguibacter sp. YZGR15]|uniref:YdcF family protein n=2 Tax=Sanguibacter suaedae TaxID=2795737 RepID=A0A934I9J3_9MICO|nr:YdcF family protein [Sanguibacter suaedae]